MSSYRLGIDVGGTNTDAVILDETLRPVASVKQPTTPDVSEGIDAAMKAVLAQAGVNPADIKYAMLGTTHATNAIVERRRLNQVAVLRIGLPATSAIKPMTSWPDSLQRAIGDMSWLVHGGHEFDGREIHALDEDAIRAAAREVAGKVTSVAITSVFSPVSPDHELRAAELVREELGADMPISLSHEIGSVGLLERENATILNAALVDVARATAQGFVQALAAENIHATVYLGQNDGTLMSVEYAQRFPVLTIACGPTNSIRGAAYLAAQRDSIVVDVGGTTSDVGVLIKGFPRESAVAVEIGGVRTGFRMPDLVSIGLGGGSIVREVDGGVTVGPDSVGYEITRKARVFGGDVLTATDIAVARGAATLGEPALVSGLDADLVEAAWQNMVDQVVEAVDRMKTSAADQPVILVGGGSIIVPPEFTGASEVVSPEFFGVANAIGSAIAQVSGQVERVYTLDAMTREEALSDARELAITEAINAGADPASIEVVDIEDVPLAYLPGNATRIRVKAAGNLSLTH